jgi:hypothetical protein
LIDAIVEPILEKFKALPGRIERTISGLEKYAKNLEKLDTVPSATEIKGFINKIS